VGLIRADVKGLLALAASCEEHASAVGGTSGPPPAGNPFQATSAAVAAAHANVAAAGTQLMQRMKSTAAAVTSAAQGYAETEAGSAGALSAVGITAV
jgi:hypothetical protein